MKHQVIAAGFAASLAVLSTTSAYAVTEIAWWHAMGAELGVKLEEVARKFNESQADYKIVPVFKGTYPETLTATIAAFRANQQPAIVQVFEVGTGTMMAAKGAVYPAYKLMADQGEAFDPKSYLPTIVGYYSDPDGNILSFPFNSSTPIMYYNKDVFKKAGLDPETPPKTWAEFETAITKIKESGAAKCGLSTAWVILDPHRKPRRHPRQALRYARATASSGLDAEFVYQRRSARAPLGQFEEVVRRGPLSSMADRSAAMTRRRSSIRRNARST